MANLQTPIGLLCYPHLFVPRPAVEGGDPRYSLCLLFSTQVQKSPEYQALKKAAAAAIDEKWPGKSGDKNFTQKLRSPFRKCEDKDRPEFKSMIGGYYIQPWSKNQPQVVDAQRQPIVIPGDVWAGQTARCSVRAFGYEQAGNRGVSFLLNNVQIADTSGPRLDGRVNAEDEFGALEGLVGMAQREPVMAGGDDEPPF